MHKYVSSFCGISVLYILQVLGVLVGMLCYSLVFPFRYVALVVGMYVLCMFTTSFQVAWWLVMGVAMYLGRSPTPAPPPPSGANGESKVPLGGNGVPKRPTTPSAREHNASSKEEKSGGTGTNAVTGTNTNGGTKKRPSLRRVQSFATPTTSASSRAAPAAPLRRSKTARQVANPRTKKGPPVPPLKKGSSFFSFMSKDS